MSCPHGGSAQARALVWAEQSVPSKQNHALAASRGWQRSCTAGFACGDRGTLSCRRSEVFSTTRQRSVEDAVAKNGSTLRVWLVLATINLLVVSYPIILLRLADTTDAHRAALLTLIGCVFLLTIVDLSASPTQMNSVGSRVNAITVSLLRESGMPKHSEKSHGNQKQK